MYSFSLTVSISVFFTELHCHRMSLVMSEKDRVRFGRILTEGQLPEDKDSYNRV